MHTYARTYVCGYQLGGYAYVSCIPYSRKYSRVKSFSEIPPDTPGEIFPVFIFETMQPMRKLCSLKNLPHLNLCVFIFVILDNHKILHHAKFPAIWYMDGYTYQMDGSMCMCAYV